jgi:hypothetical protein
MPTYVWSLTAEQQENANATRWAAANHATLVPTSTSRRNGFLGGSAGGVVVIVAHGSPQALGLCDCPA